MSAIDNSRGKLLHKRLAKVAGHGHITQRTAYKYLHEFNPSAE
jgi:hypothetical protein